MNKPAHDYQKQAILNASPTKLISILYDFGVQACYQKNEKKLHDVLSSLISSLNFDFELADSLYEIYEYCQRQARNNEFDVVRILLEDLRETWNDHVVNSRQHTHQTESKGFLV